MIRIRKAELNKNVLGNMKIAALGSGEALVNGSSVVAIGCPNGVLNSVMAGYIANDKLTTEITDGELEMFSTSIPYSEQNSGVVLDMDGRVVGMISGDFSDVTGTSSMAFIDMDGVSSVLEILQKQRQIPYMGFSGRSVDEITAKVHNLQMGAYVTEVYSDAPAYLSGMRVADVITEMDGGRIKSMRDVYRILLKHRTGDKITYTVYRRSGKKSIEKKLTAVLG